MTELAPGLDAVARLYGRSALDRLAASHVLLVGIGGVGSWAAEALVRSGLGRITLLDADEVCDSNRNRQVHALDGAVGRAKVTVMAERLRAIRSTVQVDAQASFLTPSNLDLWLGRDHDLVLDACDAFRVKLETVVWSRRRKRPLITVGAAGGRRDATQIRVRDLSRTEHDPLLSLMRKKLREEFGYPRNPKRSFGVPAVYSLEQPIFPDGSGGVCRQRPSAEPGAHLALDCGGGLGSVCHVTASFGMVAAQVALQRLLGLPVGSAG